MYLNEQFREMKSALNILFSILILPTTKGFACSCAIPKSLKAIQDYEFENSDCIFIGEVLEFDSTYNTFKIKVVESFNGDEKGKIYNGVYDQQCGPIIDGNGKWLVYGNINSENQLEINTCGLTRSFKNPESNVSATKPPRPAQPNEIISEAESRKQLDEWRAKAKSDLENEIIDLRKRIR